MTIRYSPQEVQRRINIYQHLYRELARRADTNQGFILSPDNVKYMAEVIEVSVTMLSWVLSDEDDEIVLTFDQVAEKFLKGLQKLRLENMHNDNAIH